MFLYFLLLNRYLILYDFIFYTVVGIQFFRYIQISYIDTFEDIYIIYNILMFFGYFIVCHLIFYTLLVVNI